MAELLGMSKLKNKLSMKQSRVRLRYQFYDMKQFAYLFNRELPNVFQMERSVLGWCAKSVDAIADRTVLRGFENDVFDIWGIFERNNVDILADSAILAALIGSCSFVAIIPDAETGYPMLRVIDGYNATGTIDPVTRMLTEGYAVLERDQNDQPILEAYFLPGVTQVFPKGQDPYVIKHPGDYAMLVPVIYRPDATRAFGHSRISRAAMSLVKSAMRTLQRSEISAEFYSYPQRYVLGMDPDAEQIDRWRATLTSMLRIDKDEDGDRPVVGSFQTGSMTPYSEQLKTLAGMFAGESGLTLDDLGVPSANPSSAEAIKASHETLRLTTRKAQRVFGSCFLNVGFMAASMRDNFTYQRQQLYETSALWEPIFELDASQIGSVGDAIVKIQQAFPDYFTEAKLRDLTGI